MRQFVRLSVLAEGFVDRGFEHRIGATEQAYSFYCTSVATPMRPYVATHNPANGLVTQRVHFHHSL
jgi:hypothetical protein